MEALFSDLAYAVRQFRRVPLLVGAILATLAVTIGANTLLFTIANAALFRALPHPDAARVVSPSVVQKERDIERMDEPTARLAAAGLPPFESFALYNSAGATFLGADYPERLTGARVSDLFFHVLGVGPALGRTFTGDELQTGGPNVVVLSDAVWTRRFGRRTTVVGERIPLDDGTYEVVGVMPPGFAFPAASEFWLPLRPRQIAGGGMYYVDAIARLQPSGNLEQARSALVTLRESRKHELPAAALRTGIRVMSLHQRLYGNFTQPLILLLGAVGCVLLIGCANIANLLLARSSTRRSELAIRAAIGASRRRLFRQLLIENLLLAGVGAAAGLAVAFAGLRAFRAVGPPALVRLPSLAIDGQVLLFTLALTIGTGLLFGVAPAVGAARIDPGDRLKGTRHGTRESGRPRRALVVLEIAVAVVMMLSATLLARSFIRYQAVDRGFHGENVLTASLTLPAARYADDAGRRAFFDQLVERLRALQGVESVVVSGAELSYLSMTMSWPPGGQGGDGGREIGVAEGLGDRHFHTFGVQVLEGRECAGDADESAAIVNASMARVAFPDRSAIGRSLELSHVSLGTRTIVGVVADVPNMQTKAPPLPMIFACAGRERARYGTVAVRAREGTSALSLAPALRSVVRAIDPEQPVARIRTVEQMVREGLSSRWFDAMVIGALAVLALVLALGGLYAVIAYSVAQRTREIGIRMALGADRALVLTLVLRQGGILIGAGICLGVLAAMPLVRFVSAMLFSVQPLDAAVFGGVAIGVAAVAALATFVPARRASRVDPMVALRTD
jgi:putative ABC transport system permease protein